MGKQYLPGWESHYYHSITADERAKIAARVNKLFAERTGVSRPLSRTSPADMELRRTWLRIRDEVMQDFEIEQQMEEQHRDFIESLPGIVVDDLHRLGCKRAAKLLETWELRPPAVAPRYSEPVTHVIDMDWVLGFRSAKTVYDGIFKDKIWTNEASRQRFAEIWRNHPVAVGRTFGDLSRPAPEVAESWINTRPVDSFGDKMDLAAALGRFVFHVSVLARVRVASPQQVLLAIEEVGVCVKDSFDFNGSQFLGFWGHRDSPASNADFREWRKLQNHGGDFLVYSDVKRTKVSPSDVVTVDRT